LCHSAQRWREATTLGDKGKRKQRPLCRVAADRISGRAAVLRRPKLSGGAAAPPYHKSSALMNE